MVYISVYHLSFFTNMVIFWAAHPPYWFVILKLKSSPSKLRKGPGYTPMTGMMYDPPDDWLVWLANCWVCHMICPKMSWGFWSGPGHFMLGP